MNAILQLKITLKDTKPSIWRRFLVHKKTSFLDLHYIIQAIMGWENYHLYEFNLNGFKIGEVDTDFGLDEDDIIDSSKVTLEKVISKEKEKFQYEYDFGDGWTHQIIVEKFLPIDPKTKYPICIKGKLNCPPEDCGGVWGFYNLLEIINDKKNPEREEMIEWLGEDYDKDYFNLDEINKNL